MSEESQGSTPSIVESPAASEGNAIESSESTENILEEIEAQEEDSIEASPEEKKQEEKKAVEAALKKRLKLKVDGEEIEEEIDLANEEELKKRLQKAKAFDKRSQEYASFRSQVDALLKDLQNNPEAVLEKMGLNVDEFAEKRLRRKIEELEKSPEQLEREKMQKELEQLKKEKEEAERQRREAEMEKLRNETAKQIENDIMGALTDSKSILPKQNPEIIQRIARAMYFAMQNGFPEVTAKDVVPLVEKQYREELSSLFGAIPEDLLEDLIGKPNLDRLRKKRLAMQKAKTQTAKQVIKDSGASKAEEAKEKRQVRIKDFFRAE